MWRIEKVVNTLFFWLFKLIPVSKSRIVYMSHYGKDFSDSPMEIYSVLSTEKSSIENIIVLNDLEKQVNFKRANTRFVKFGTLKYYFYCATSKMWIFNVTTSEFMKPRKKTFYLQTWHGIPLKKIGNDIVDESLSIEKKRWSLSARYWDMFLSPSPYFDSFFQSAFDIDKNIIWNKGLPREDFFKVKTSEKRKEIKNELNIVDEKINVLYAPTFRQGDMIGFPYPIDLRKFSDSLGNNYRILVKLHPNIKTEKSFESENITYYKSDIDVNKLLLITDILITDYSSLFFDYTLLQNSMIFFAFDLENYQTVERGFYFDYENFVPGPIVKNQMELVSAIKNKEWDDSCYQDKYTHLKKIMNNTEELTTLKLCDFINSEVLIGE